MVLKNFKQTPLNSKAKTEKYLIFEIENPPSNCEPPAN